MYARVSSLSHAARDIRLNDSVRVYVTFKGVSSVNGLLVCTRIILEDLKSLGLSII